MLQGSVSGTFRYLMLAALALCFGLFLSYLLRDIGKSAQPLTSLPSSAAGQSISDSRPQLNQNTTYEIATSNPDPAPSPVQLQSVVETNSLRLTLEGVFLASDPKKATAMIRNSDGLSKLYYIGEVLAEQVVLDAISRDYVVVLQDGKTIRLGINTNRTDPGLANNNSLPTAYQANTTRNSENDGEYSGDPSRLSKQQVMNRLQTLRQGNFGRTQSD